MNTINSLMPRLEQKAGGSLSSVFPRLNDLTAEFTEGSEGLAGMLKVRAQIDGRWFFNAIPIADVTDPSALDIAADIVINNLLKLTTETV